MTLNGCATLYCTNDALFKLTTEIWEKIDPYLPYLTLPSGWAGCYTCPALRPIDPYCQHQKCSPGTLLSDGIRLRRLKTTNSSKSC